MEINNLLGKFKLFSFHHRLVFRLTMFIKIIHFSSTLSQFNKWLKPTTLENDRYDLCSNQLIIFLADHSCLSFGDITFKKLFQFLFEQHYGTYRTDPNSGVPE